jgi:hypothetical protein
LQEVTRHRLFSSLAEGPNAAIILSMLLQLIRRPYPILNHQPIKEFDHLFEESASCPKYWGLIYNPKLTRTLRLLLGSKQWNPPRPC